ncbi:unnamed protein product [Heligmosomoides polygyrus]|uniref:Uncharacterized protein n=1 Tax=Heligmosomoides polygyrus TaxID=6339 RepID=A0A183G446_HELPZ|nr:unnamed protein product [Heligmosomoides polygyrus]
MEVVETAESSSGSKPDLHSDFCGAAAPSTYLAGAHAPSFQLAGAVAPLLQSDKASASKFSFANVVARQRAAEEAATAADSVAAIPLPMVSRKRTAAQLTLQTHHQLPERTPRNHTHRLIDRHPWAQYVTLRKEPIPTDPEAITSLLPTTVYRHIKAGGYLSSKFGHSLFPRSYRETPSPQHRLPIM